MAPARTPGLAAGRSGARAGGRWQRRASRGTGSEAWALLGGLQVAIPFQERGQDREPHLASGPSAARCEGADGGGRVAAEALPAPSLPGLAGLTQSSGLAPLKFPSRAHRPPDRREVSGARPAALLATPRRCPPCAQALSDRSPVPERRGGAGGAGTGARPGTAGRAGWRRWTALGPGSPSLQEVVGLLINLAIERRNKVCKDGSQVNAAYSCKTNLVYAICQAGDHGVHSLMRSKCISVFYPSPTVNKMRSVTGMGMGIFG